MMRYSVGLVCACAFALCGPPLLGCDVAEEEEEGPVGAGGAGGTGGTPGAGGTGGVSCEGVACEGDGNDCTTEACDPKDGMCKSTPVEDDTACDGKQGTCRSGTCEVSGLDGCGDVLKTYQDGDFAAGDWTSAEVEALSQGIQSITRIDTKPTGGNPAAYQEVEISLTATEDQVAAIWVGHALDEAVYDPGASGEICGVRFFLDGTDQYDPYAPHNAIFSVFLEQDGTLYWAGKRLRVESDTWERGAWVYPGDIFTRIGDIGPAAPDFTAGGAPIQFGYLNGNSRPTTAPGTGQATAAADNLKVEIFPPE